MKTEKTLALAIARNLTIDQQKELAAMITALAVSAKNYGVAAATDKPITDTLQSANAAWSALMQVGLNVAF